MELIQHTLNGNSFLYGNKSCYEMGFYYFLFSSLEKLYIFPFK
jgi:hypothetical protein